MRLLAATPRPGLRRAVLAGVAAAVVLWTQLSASIGFRGEPELTSYRDFGSLWASGQAANEGLGPYDPYPFTYRVRTPAGEQAAVNLNPPLSVLFLQATARFDPGFMFRYWQLGSALLYVAVVLGLTRAFPSKDGWLRALLMLLWQPFWSTLDLGQLYIALLLPSAAAVLLIDRYPTAAGLCIGLVAALKPPYLLWPCLLLGARHWRPAFVALGTAAGLSALPAALGYLAWYEQWLDASREAAGTLLLADNLSWLSVLVRFGVPASTGAAVIFAVLLALLFVVARRRLAAPHVSAIALVAAVVASPVAWVGYAVLLVPVFLSRVDWPEPLLLSGILLAVPGAVLWWTIESGFVVYELALILCLIGLLLEGREHTPQSVPAPSQPGYRHLPDPTREYW